MIAQAVAVARGGDSLISVLQSALHAGAVFIALWCAWVTAMGHSEPNWAYGYRSGAIGVLILWTISVVLPAKPMRVWLTRAAIYVVGIAAATALGGYVWNLEQPLASGHADSSSYLVFLLFLSLFWTCTTRWRST